MFIVFVHNSHLAYRS